MPGSALWHAIRPGVPEAGIMGGIGFIGFLALAALKGSDSQHALGGGLCLRIDATGHVAVRVVNSAVQIIRQARNERRVAAVAQYRSASIRSWRARLRIASSTARCVAASTAPRRVWSETLSARASSAGSLMSTVAR